MAKKFPPLRLFLISLLVSFGGSFHFGYQLTLTNPSQVQHRPGVTGAKEHLERGHCSAVRGCDSRLTAVAASGRSSRKEEGAIHKHEPNNIRMHHIGVEQVVGRLLFGVSIGLALGLTSLLLSESSPKACRGFVSMTTGILLQVGVIAGSTSGMQIVFGRVDSWPMIYWVEIVPLVVLMASLPFMNESPSYLVANGKEHEARISIKNYHNCALGELDKTLTEIKSQQQQSGKRMTLLGVFKDKESRRGTLVGCIVAFGMAFCGIAVINSFAVQMFRDVGLSTKNASIANVGLGVVSCIGNIVSAVVIDKCGRRPLLLVINTFLIAINFVVFGLMYSYRELQLTALGYCLIAVIALFIFAFGMGPGPMVFFITSEMVSQRARSAGQSLTNMTQIFFRGAILAVYLPLEDLVGPFSYAILFFVPPIVATVLLYFYLPETKNRTLDQVKVEIEKLPKFNNCRGGKNVDGDMEANQKDIHYVSRL